jgi:drug/metabolite transporter (DMT)-like permease
MNQTLLYGLVLLSAIGHASWNALLKGTPDRLAMMVMIRIVGLVYGLVVLASVGFPTEVSVFWLAAASMAMWAYHALLIQGYQAGDLSFVYPLARGIAPLLLTALAFVAIGERVSVVQFVGVLAISLGVITLGVLGRGGKAGLHYAGLTGASIAAYSFLSGAGVRVSNNLLGFSALLETVTGFGILVYAAAARTRLLAPSLVKIWPTGLLSGVISVAGYLSFLVAANYLPIGPVSAMRECSALFGVLIGVLVLKEPFGTFRIAAAVLMTGGILLLSVI